MANNKRNDILVRAIKTFVQAFLAVIATGLLDVTDLNALKTLAIAGIAAGISAVSNTLIQ